MKQAKWMWCPNAFERYHGMKLHNRRTEGGVFHEPMWRIDAPERNLFLYKSAFLEKEETIRFFANTTDAVISVSGKRYPPNSTATVPAGKHMVKVYAYKDGGFPAVYIEGDVFTSDESWRHGSFGGKDLPAGTNDMYTSLSDDPEVFKFAYKRIYPVKTEKLEAGTLFDFGKESFGNIVFENISLKDAKFTAYCGESREEAMDTEHSIVIISVSGECYHSESVAFRYVFVPDFGGEYKISADFEYLPIENKGEFASEDELLNKIYEVAVYTLGLNSREGFLDGIKRDRWVWGGDAYQSFLANYYLASDKDIVRRTFKILRGADPVTMHINTIPDYTFYWIISLWEYYFHTGDAEFVASIYRDMRSLLDFAESRLSEDGLYERCRGDWVFVDWAEHFDKDAGPICAEQMLLCRAYECAANCAELMKDEEYTSCFLKRAKEVREKINALYWDEEKNAFVDEYKTGNRNVTRHANIFALLYNLTTEERKEKIIAHVIKNNEIPAIVTPYFRFFELAAMCDIGDFAYVLESLRSYWGGMINEGATSFWEKYEPDQKGAEHYAMYGRRYGKSLCHAWGGTSPIYVIGKYILGVKPTSVNFETYEVRPSTGELGIGDFSGKVPTQKGDIEVSVSCNEVSILSPIDGGKLFVNGKEYIIPKDEKLIVKR
ncbi:MAG: alpha-rhamnosidase [Clostridia bacterium]|nr:alpha-rhamnosidase [Clostridia bacterium]